MNFECRILNYECKIQHSFNILNLLVRLSYGYREVKVPVFRCLAEASLCPLKRRQAAALQSQAASDVKTIETMIYSRVFVALVLLFLTPPPVFSEEAPAPTVSVSFSDASRLEGRLIKKPDFKVSVDCGGVKELRLSEIVEIKFSPSKETLERAWRFKEAGKTDKEFHGEAYPLRHLTATVRLSGGTELKGDLKTFPLDLVDGSGKKRKVILLSKQRGEPGDTLETLVYPTLVTFKWTAPAAAEGVIVRVKPPPGEASDEKRELSVLSKPGLLSVKPEPGGDDGSFIVKKGVAGGAIAAYRTKAGITVGWPSSPHDRGLVDKIAAVLPDQRDFFDGKTILAASPGADEREVYTLILLERKGKTTLAGPDSSPWRLDVWRWSGDADEGRFALANRGSLFRGIGPADATPPKILIDPDAVSVSPVSK